MKVIGNGSLIQRDKTKPRSRCRDWEIQVVVESDDGRRDRKYRAFHGTYTQGLEARAAFVDELRGTPVTSDMPFPEYARRWHEDRVKSDALARRTMKSEWIKLRNAMPHLDKAIGEITREDIERTYRALQDGETLSGRPWAPKTVDNLHRILGKLFRDAVRDGYAACVPTDGVELPKRKTRKVRVLSNAEMDNMLEKIDYSDGAGRAVALCCACGLRRSEALAVRWEDFADGSVKIDASLEDNGEEKDTKTGRVRTVPVPEHIAMKLEPYRSTGPICGGMLPNSLGKWWRRNRDSLGMDCTLHELRHGYATRLARAGVHPRLTMSLCGWSSIQVCMEIYTHVSDDMQRDAVSCAFESPVRD